jgi:hypothetical protein
VATGHDHVGAFTGECHSSGAADAGEGAGDENNLLSHLFPSAMREHPPVQTVDRRHLILGSIRRWEADADGIGIALAAHDEVMTPVINTCDVDSADGEEPKPIAAAGTLRVESRPMVALQASAE